MVELADMVINITNSNSTKVYLPPLEEGDMTRRQPYTGKMKKVLDRRLITLEEGIVRTMDFIKAKL